MMKLVGTLIPGPFFGSLAAGVHIGGGGSVLEAMSYYFNIGMVAILLGLVVVFLRARRAERS